MKWGRLLVLKTLLVLLTCMLGAYHWRLLRPCLGTERASLTLRRTARLEFALAAGVLLVTCLSSCTCQSPTNSIVGLWQTSVIAARRAVGQAG